MDVRIKPLRPVISGQTLSVQFSVEVSPPSSFEIVCVSEADLLLPEHRARRTPSNFYSTSESGWFRATPGAATVGLPPKVVARLSQGSALYYVAAAKDERGAIALSVDPRSSSVPSIGYEPSIAKRGLWSTAVGAAGPARSLTWSGDSALMTDDPVAVAEDGRPAEEDGGAATADADAMPSPPVEPDTSPPTDETAAPPPADPIASGGSAEASDLTPAVTTPLEPDIAVPPAATAEATPTVTEEAAPALGNEAVPEVLTDEADPAAPIDASPDGAATGPETTVTGSPALDVSTPDAPTPNEAPPSPTAAPSDDLPGIEHGAPAPSETPDAGSVATGGGDALALLRILVSLDPCVTFRGLDGLTRRLGLTGERSTALLLECVVAQGVAALDARWASEGDVEATSGELLAPERVAFILDTPLLR